MGINFIYCYWPYSGHDCIDMSFFLAFAQLGKDTHLLLDMAAANNIVAGFSNFVALILVHTYIHTYIEKNQQGIIAKLRNA